MRRKRRRRIRYRPGNQRSLRILRLALVVTASVALALSLQTAIRSVKNARLNGKLEVMHTVAEGAAPAVEVAAPPLGAARPKQTMTLSRMGLPDGTAIENDSAPGILHYRADGFLPDMQKLVYSNPDTVGWLHIKGIVSLPVVYRDNRYYLDHDFNGGQSASGTLFLDVNHPLTPNAQNLLIHGHSMFDGSMFGLLTHYQRAETLKAHPLISFSTLWEKETYAVFAVLKVSSKIGDARYFDYASHPAFASDADFNAYIESVRALSIFDIPVDVRPGDALLTLSTCLDDDRLVVLARKLRAGESRDELLSAVEAEV